MKITVKKLNYSPVTTAFGKRIKYCIQIQTNDKVQTFQFIDAVHYSKKDYEWVAKMFKIALKNDRKLSQKPKN